MDLKKILMALENQFWEASSAANIDLIRGYLTDDALTVAGSIHCGERKIILADNQGEQEILPVC